MTFNTVSLKPSFYGNIGNHTPYTYNALVEYAKAQGYSLVQPTRGSHFGIQDPNGNNVTFLTCNNSHVSLDKLKDFLRALHKRAFTNKTAKETMENFLKKRD